MDPVRNNKNSTPPVSSGAGTPISQSNIPATSPPRGEPPKKYIRTLHSDMKVLQENGTPDLVPLPDAPRAEAPRTPEPPLPSQPLFSPAAPPGLPELGRPSTKSDLVLGKPAPIVNTYASDFSARVKETNATTASIIAAEQDAGPVPTQAPEVAPRGGSWGYVAGGALLLLVGTAGAYLAYTRYLAATLPVAILPSAATPIFVDDRKEISGSGEALMQAVRQAIAEPLAPNAVRLLSHTATTPSNSGQATDAAVFSLLPINAPSVLLRNITASGSMAGIIHTRAEQSPFFILRVASYGSTLAGLLAWEPDMPRSLAELFPPYLAPAVSIAPAATTTSATTTPKTASTKATATTTPAAKPSFTPGFRDEVIANHDVRVYRDGEGRSVVLYGYWNQATLVIARDPEAFMEILGRLATSRS